MPFIRPAIRRTYCWTSERRRFPPSSSPWRSFLLPHRLFALHPSSQPPTPRAAQSAPPILMTLHPHYHIRLALGKGAVPCRAEPCRAVPPRAEPSRAVPRRAVPPRAPCRAVPGGASTIVARAVISSAAPKVHPRQFARTLQLNVSLLFFHLWALAAGPPPASQPPSQPVSAPRSRPADSRAKGWGLAANGRSQLSVIMAPD